MPNHNAPIGHPPHERVLFLMLGLPSSGKTTWCRNWTSVPTIHMDHLRHCFHGQEYIEQLEPWIIELAHMFAKTLLHRYRRIVVDDANWTRHRRRFFFFHGVTTHMLWRKATVEQCLERAPAERQERLQAVARAFEPPDESEWEGYGDPFITIV